MATGYSLSIIDEEMFNNKPPAFLFSTGQEEKQSHKPREWMCFGVCFVVVLSYKECLSKCWSFLKVSPGLLSKKYSSCSTIFIDDSTVSQPNLKSTIKWSVKVHCVHCMLFLELYIQYIYTLMSYIMSIYYWMHVKKLFVVCFILLWFVCWQPFCSLFPVSH